MRVVFMGTPDIAAASLSAIIEANFEVCAVFTQPDRPKNRGMKMQMNPVKTLAVEKEIPVYQPTTLRDGESTKIIKELAPDAIAVVAYGRLIPDDIIELAPLGCINIHASLLPKYRGSAPIQWSVINGDKITGLTSMYIATELDAGDMIYKSELEIGEFDTSGELFDRMCPVGGELLVKTLTDLEAGTAPRQAQDHDKSTHAPMLSREMSPINWDKTPREVVKHIYGMNPWPAATMQIGELSFKVFGAEYTENKTDKIAGTVVSAGKKGIEIACAGGETLMITKIQASGGRAMAAADYLRGHPIEGIS